MPKGFTLVEIMIVVAIIGILIAVAVPGFVRAREASRQTTCQNNLAKIDQAMQQYVIEEREDGDLEFPLDLEDLVGEDQYIRNTPICPAGGTYTLGIPNSSEPVTCSIGANERFPVYPHRLVGVLLNAEADGGDEE